MKNSPYIYFNSSLFGFFVALAAPCTVADTEIQSEENTQAESQVVLEEVFVSARKRREIQAEVPLSLSVISGQQLAERGVEKIDELTQNLPGLRYLETGVATQLTVRGVGSAGNQGFEQSVGMYIDGVHYGRAALFRMPLFDLERVELLRGPQNILFGKNAIAGALNIRSARPVDSGQVQLSYRHNPEFSQSEWNMAASTAPNDALRVRVALRQFDEEGFLYNSWLAEDEVQREERSYRLSTEWDASPDLNIFVKWEQHDLQSQGRNALITHDESLSNGLNYAEYLQLFSYAPFDVGESFTRVTNIQDASEGEIDHLSLVGRYDFSHFSLESTTAFLAFETAELCDCDFVSAEIIHLNLDESYEQFSQEFRIEAASQSVDWQAGLYYQNFDQQFSDRVSVYDSNFFLNQIPEIANTGIARHFDQQSDSWAVFASASWMLNETLRLNLGGRFSQESKTADKRIDIIHLEDSSVVSDPLIAYRYLSVFAVENEQAHLVADPDMPRSEWQPLHHSGHNVRGERDENAFSPNIVLEWVPARSSRYYASWSQGYKSGGFDPRSNRVGNFSMVEPTEEAQPLLHFEFEKEKVNAFELGNKRSFLSGRAEIHTALFYSTFENLQTSQFDGGSGFVVGNVAALNVQGLEVEGRWNVRENLNAHYSLVFLDAEYDDFKNANCYAGQEKDGLDIDGNGSIDTCDASGKRPPYTPEFTLNLGLDYKYNLKNRWQAKLSVFTQHLGKQLVNSNLDPSAWQAAVNLLNLRASLSYSEFYVALLAKNILDEYHITNTDGLPLAELEFSTNTQAGWVQRPRSVAIELGMTF